MAFPSNSRQTTSKARPSQLYLNPKDSSTNPRQKNSHPGSRNPRSKKTTWERRSDPSGGRGSAVTWGVLRCWPFSTGKLRVRGRTRRGWKSSSRLYWRKAKPSPQPPKEGEGEGKGSASAVCGFLAAQQSDDDAAAVRQHTHVGTVRVTWHLRPTEHTSAFTHFSKRKRMDFSFSFFFSIF